MEFPFLVAGELSSYFHKQKDSQSSVKVYVWFRQDYIDIIVVQCVLTHAKKCSKMTSLGYT